MAGNCDLCGEKLGFRKFHCQDGVVCKKCYAIVSNGFSETIAKKTLAELKKTYEANAVPIDLGEDGFVVTRKIKPFLLIDEQNKKFCISGNPTVSKEYSRPEIYHYDDLMAYMLVCDPELTPEELVHLKEDKKTVKVIKKLKVRLKIRGVGIKDIVVLSRPVRSSTFAFRKSYQLAMDIMRELNAIHEA